MIKHLKYLSYVLRHKWYVLVYGLRLGVPLRRLLAHDLSKFSRAEWSPYVNHFYGKKPHRRDKTGYYKPTNTGDLNFDLAWLHHAHNNPHHWQWWVLPREDGTVTLFEMPIEYIREMIADWCGAGAAQGRKNVKEWYEANKDKMIFASSTRTVVEIYIEHVVEGVLQ